MKLLMIVESLRDGGKQRRLVELARALLIKKEYTILIIILKDAVHYQEVLHMEGVEVKYLKRSFRADPRVAFSFYRIASGFSPDVVHSWGGLPSMVALPYILLSHKPFVNGMIANSRLRRFSKNWFRTKLTFPFSDVIISNSLVGLKVYRVPSGKGLLIRNGINFDRVKHPSGTQDLRRIYDISPGNKVVGMVATIDWRKNFPMFVKTAMKMLEERRDLTFFIVGDGSDKEKIKRMIPSELLPFFIFTGKIRNVEEVVSLFDVAVLASFGEGTSNSLLEYMLMEKPVVATNVPGIDEVVVQGVTGYLVPQNQAGVMKNRISELLDDPDRGHMMGLAGKKQVARQYSIFEMVSKFETVYKKVMKK